MATLLLALGVLISLVVSFPLAGLLLLYVFLCTLYTFSMKRIVLLDVFLLAGLYCLRIFVGGIAADVTVSFWLFTFSMFFFLGLAYLERFLEVKSKPAEVGEGFLPGRGYGSSDRGLIRILGTSSGYLSSLVLALYLHSEEIHTLYERPGVLWISVPLQLYWVSRLWLLADHGQIEQDLVRFLLTDGPTLILLVVSLLVLYSAA